MVESDLTVHARKEHEQPKILFYFILPRNRGIYFKNYFASLASYQSLN